MINDYFSIENTYNTMLSMFSKDFTFNNNSYKCLLKEIDDKYSGRDTKYLLTDASLNQGNLIKFDTLNYLIITKNENINNSYNKYTIKKCPYTINFVIDGIINPIPSIIDTKTLDIASSQYIVLPDGKIIVTLQANNITNTISINDRFIKMGFPWMITAIDKSLEGLILLHADIQQIGADDDIINEIPKGAVLASFTIKFTTDYNGDIEDITSHTDSGNPYKVLKGDTIIVTAYTFQESTQASDTFTFSFSGVSTSYYTKTTPDGNHFTVHNVNGNGGQYLMCNAVSNLDSSLTHTICIRLAGEW